MSFVCKFGEIEQNPPRFLLNMPNIRLKPVIILPQFSKFSLRNHKSDRLLGHSNQSRILLICHCERESGNLIRIISARKATAKERKLYKGDA